MTRSWGGWYREGRRKEFRGFRLVAGGGARSAGGSDISATRSCNWDEVDQGIHAEVLDWYRRLITLRTSGDRVDFGRVCRRAGEL